ncbi:MAG: ATP-binding cassette domain-containing protein [Haliscomenobacter sp.]|nr:ATP-binding cassette domain-containing protein [Haliscomenobacter sp.]MBP9076642.1 ATP-binding cassette domain-containing protein [Haliscomenobacter sp.]MBP9874321.1 ATP-binding cassette domain-containing protein [Haliscomenobacter sp.]
MAENSNGGLTPVQRFFRLLALDRKDITYIYIYAIFAGLITLILPLGVQAIIGLIAGGAISASLLALIGMVTLATALSGLLKVMQMSVTETIQQRIFVRSAFDFSYRLPRLRLDTLVGYYPPELVNRFFDTLTIQKGLPKILIDFSTAILQIIFGLLLISFYHPFYVFFSLLLLFTMFLIFRLTGPKGLSTSLKESKYKYQVAHWLEEQARSITTFKLAGDTPFALQRLDSLVASYLKSRREHFRILIGQFGSIVGFEVLVMASLLALGSFLVLENQINIGQFVAADIVIILVLASSEKLIVTMETIYDVLTALDKLGYVTDLPTEDNKGLPFEECDRGRGMELQLDNVRFAFPDSEKPILNGITLSVKSGEAVCISGYNGAGKTTLLELIAGLFPHFQGSINYNGFPLRSLHLASLRRHIGDFMAEENIFRGSIWENIALYDPSLSLNQVIQTAEKLGLADFVRKLPDGFNTQLLPEGRNIPRSIRQKIMVARAIAPQPRLLVVEDVFSALEPADRRCIADCLTAPDRPWTLVMVSNDPLYASRCDRIVILNEGQVEEEGNFEQITKSKHFNALFLKDAG